MDPIGQFVRRFPLVARPRPACGPLTSRVADLCERARRAERSGDLAEASAVHNQAALVASDCALPDLARQWCHRQANVYLRAHPLGAQVARHAVEPLTNLARLYIREGQGERAFDLMDTLFAAVSSRVDANVDGVEIPADLTNSEQAHQETRRWLWAVLLATGARALAVAGRWTDARDRLRKYKGVGYRMLDGRQVEVIAAATSGDSERARALLHDTAPGEPWENAVTACLTFMCRNGNDIADIDDLLAQYHALDTSSPGLSVFRTRLGLSFVDSIGGIDDPRARRIAADLVDCNAAWRDGYVARDILAHNGCRELLTGAQEQALTDLVEVCSLGSGTFPAPLLADLTAALRSVEEIMARQTLDIAPTRP
jgi:hypothetical protein